MASRIIVPPATEAISLDEAKEHLKIRHTDEDHIIQIYIAAAREWMEGPNGFLRRSLVRTTWEQHIDGFPDLNAEIQIDVAPLISVASVKYDDSAGNEQTLSAANYFVDLVSEPGWILCVDGQVWPTTLVGANTVRIVYDAGYASGNSPPTDTIPANLKQAMLLMIGHFYANKEENVAGTVINELPMGVESLIRGHRIHLGMA